MTDHQSPDLIERLRKDAWLSRETKDVHESKRAKLVDEAATALEAAQARIAELEDKLGLERALSDGAHRRARDARAQALEEAAKLCDDEADKCDDAVKWGGSRAYIKRCEAASYAMRNRAAAIRALKGDHTND